MEKNIMDHLVAYPFKEGEVVTIGGNPNVLGEVTDISDNVQIGVRILTPPQAGNMVFTTRFTYYSTPMPHLSAKDIREKYSSVKQREIKLAEQVKTVKDVPETLDTTQLEVVNNVEFTHPTQEVTEEEVISDALVETFNENESTNYEFSETTEGQKNEVVAEVVSTDEDFMQLSLF